MKTFALTLVVFLLSISVNSRTILKGTVRDSLSGAPVPFALVFDKPDKNGSSTDIDGIFQLAINVPCKIRVIAYGYEEKIINVSNAGRIEIQIRPKKLLPITEIENNTNPAIPIIRKASKARKEHDPVSVPAYTCKKYTKTIVTAENKKRPGASIDSLLEGQYLFLSESVSNIKSKRPAFREETILASRVSGAAIPSLTLLASQLQSFTFYSNEFILFEKQFLSPLAPTGINGYLYELTSQMITGRDTLFVIRFEPKNISGFSGLRGEIQISSKGYAVQHVRAEPILNNETLAIHILQAYSPADSVHWFPVQMSTTWYNNLITLNDSAATINRSPAKIDSTRSRTIVICRSYLSEIHTDTSLKRRQFSDTQLDYENNGSQYSDNRFLGQYRPIPLTKKERTTYNRLDSLGDVFHFNKRLQLTSSVTRGRLPLGPVDLDLGRLITYNSFEGFRLGAGFHTGTKFSERFRTGGYFAYGFRDKAFKYGADASFMLRKKNGMTVYINWQSDLTEGGAIHYRLDDHPKGSEMFRVLYRKRFDEVLRSEAGFRFRAMHHFLFDLFVSRQLRKTNDGYQFVIRNGNAAVYLSQYAFTETGIAFRFAFRERYATVLGERTLIAASHWPMVWGEVAQGIGQQEYLRAGLKISYRAAKFIFGASSFQLHAGQVWGDVPYGQLFAGRGTYGQYEIGVHNSFETMGVNEFLSDRYLSFFYAHSFRLKFGKLYRPELVLRTSAGIGSLSHPESHAGISFQTMEKGYYESGLELNKLLGLKFAGLGLGAFWRYGPYSNPDAVDNLVVKFTLDFLF